MFEQLPAGMNIYATTAANAGESSWGPTRYYDPVDGKDRLRSAISIGQLMQDSTRYPRSRRRGAVPARQKLTTKSHVTQFGDTTTIAAELVSDFQGATGAKAAAAAAVVAPPTVEEATATAATEERGMLDSRAAELQHAFAKFMASESAVDAAALTALVEERVRVNALAAIATAVAPHATHSGPCQTNSATTTLPSRRTTRASPRMAGSVTRPSSARRHHRQAVRETAGTMRRSPQPSVSGPMTARAPPEHGAGRFVGPCGQRDPCSGADVVTGWGSSE